jgi:anti-sigma factor RsiW
MMKTHQEYELLLRALDETLSAEQTAQLERALTESNWLRQERARLLRLRAHCAALRLPEDEEFADRLMPRLAPARMIAHTIAHFSLRAAAIFVFVFLLALLSVYLTEGSLTPEAIIGTRDLSVDDAFTLLGN